MRGALHPLPHTLSRNVIEHFTFTPIQKKIANSAVGNYLYCILQQSLISFNTHFYSFDRVAWGSVVIKALRY